MVYKPLVALFAILKAKGVPLQVEVYRPCENNAISPSQRQ